MTLTQSMIKASAGVPAFGRPSQEALIEYNRLKAALDQEARDNWDNEKWHREVAAVLSSNLDYGFEFNNLFGSYFQVESVGEFDTVSVEETRGLKVFYTSRGGYIDESQINTQRWELPRDTIGFHVSEHEDKLRAGFATTIERLVGLAGSRLDAEVNRRMFNLLQAAIPNSGSPYYVNATGGVSKAHIDGAIRDVSDAIKPNGAGPIPITIIGRAAVLDAMSNVLTQVANQFDTGASQEVRERGYLGNYRGANVVKVQNYTDELGASYIPANELWVFGGTVGKFAMYGGMQTKSWVENTVDYRHYRGRKDIGGLIHHPEQARRIVDGTITP
jgi:hypothetical protein